MVGTLAVVKDVEAYLASGDPGADDHRWKTADLVPDLPSWTPDEIWRMAGTYSPGWPAPNATSSGAKDTITDRS